MNRLQRWFADRDRAEEQAVIRAIGMLRPSQASAYPPIGRLAGLGPGKVHVVLARLEGSGRVTSDWADGPHPRRRLYRVVSATSRSEAGS